MFCRNCGKEIKDSSQWCQYCGHEQKSNTSKEPISQKPQSQAQQVMGTGSQNAVVPPKARSKKKWTLPVVAIGIIAVVIVFFVSMFQNEAKYINTVKNGALDMYPGVIIGEAFDQFFQDPEWSYTDLGDQSTKGIRHSVDFEGKCYVNEELTRVTLWFSVDDDAERFEYLGGFIEGQPKNISADDVFQQALWEAE